MNLKRTRTVLLTALGVAAMSVAPAAVAKQDGSGKEKDKAVGYVFKGTYNADGTVTVTKGNKHVDKAGLVGQTVAFDFSEAKVTVGDTNADGTSDLSDVVAGDEVKVKAKLPKPDPGAAPFAAKHLIDKTNPPADPEPTV